jgi:ribbon-helix-helix CopG family protein
VNLLLREPGAVGSGGSHAVFVDRRIVADDVGGREPSGERVEYDGHEHSGALDAGLAVAHVRVDRDQLEQLLGRHPTSVPYPPALRNGVRITDASVPMSARPLCTAGDRRPAPQLCNTIFVVPKRAGVEPSKPYRTRTGKVLADADIETLATEVDRDYDAASLKTRRRGRPTMGSAAAEVVPVRLDPELKRAVEARARRERATTSEIIRLAIRSFLETE